MGKKEECKRVKKAMEGFVLTSDRHIHDLCCDLDRYMDDRGITGYLLYIVGTRQVTYIEEDYGIKLRVSPSGLEIR